MRLGVLPGSSEATKCLSKEKKYDPDLSLRADMKGSPF